MKNKTKLSVFDFDGTLIDTPLADKGRAEYEKKTGKPWPHKGWWGQEDSLDMNIFDMKPIPSVVADYKKERANPDAMVVMLTGRIQKFGHKVKAILDANGLIFDGYYYNTGGSTDDNKKKTFDKILHQNPQILAVELWDDRMEHIPIFEAWGKEKMESGRLNYFNINVVLSGHH